MLNEPMSGETLKKRASRSGWIEVITGAMFSGKTEELIRRLNRALIARQKVEIYKPTLDDRFRKDQVVSHDEKAIASSPVNFATDIYLMSFNCNVVGIDEAQFFDEDLIRVADQLAYAGKRVIIAGLDMDYEGVPFGPMPGLMAIAEYVTKLHAVCIRCGEPAGYSHRISDDNDRVLVGEKDKYEPLCRQCFNEVRSKN